MSPTGIPWYIWYMVSDAKMPELYIWQMAVVEIGGGVRFS